MRRALSQADAELAELLDPGEGLADFIARVTPLEPAPAHIRRHLVPLLERARVEPVRAIVTMPPRHAKSRTITKALAWVMSRHPTLEHGYVTHSRLWQEHSDYTREMVQRAGLKLRQDRRALDTWKLPEGGGMWSAGMQGSITGRPVTGWLVIDDPHDGPEDAESPTQREHVWVRFLGKCYTRLQRGSSCIVPVTRWNVDDLPGRLTTRELGDKWEIINLPAVSDASGNPCSTSHPDARALWPEEFPLEALRAIEKTQGHYRWSALYQGQPVPKGGTMFHDPGRFRLADFRLDGHRLAIGADPAGTEGTRGDASCAVLMAVKGHGADARAWILDRLHMRVTVPEFARALVAWQRVKRCKVWVEGIGVGRAVPQIIREIAPTLDLTVLTPAASKFVRSQPFSSAWNDGRVLVPDDAPWAEDMIAEIKSFTGIGAGHDDQLDAAVFAWEALYSTRRQVQRSPLRLPFG
ncbi:MAG: phage terminase large subunit [Deltaproteobacteria bacterium]|nr:phage terminase large subunit [Deltaproteobacteria bacterium]